MKAPITWVKFRTYALTSALTVFGYAMLIHILGMPRAPTTIKQFLVLFVLILGLLILIHIYRNRKKKSPALPEDR